MSLVCVWLTSSSPHPGGASSRSPPDLKGKTSQVQVTLAKYFIHTFQDILLDFLYVIINISTLLLHDFSSYLHPLLLHYMNVCESIESVPIHSLWLLIQLFLL